MNKDFMPEMDADQRLQLLKEQCDSHESRSYYRDLSTNELDVKREELSENLIKISEFDDVLDEAKTEYKSKAQPLKLENKELLTEVKTRKAKVDGILFHFANHTDGVMDTYNELGEYIESRRLRPEEKQAKLFQVPKSGTHD